MLAELQLTRAPVAARAALDEIALLGEIQVNEGAYAEVASPLPARVLTMLAAPGTRVRPGTALATLQSIELGQARAAFLSSQARARLAQSALERKRSLAKERIVAGRELQEAEAEAAAALAEMRAARAALGALGVSAEGAGSVFTLRSPIAGEVIERTIVRGQLADPSRPAFKVADLSHLWLVAHASERDADHLRIGADAQVHLPSDSDRTLLGTVTLVGREVDPGSRTVPVRIELASPSMRLRPGMSATVTIASETGGAPMLTVPVTALQHLRDGWYVFLPRATGTFVLREVERGRDVASDIEVRAGLRAGDVVIADGAFLLKAEAEKASGAMGEEE
jgi:cobalt-zinc-cadmium efflux system membrane fusion protein